MPAKYRLEMGKTDRKRSRFEIILNGSITRTKVVLPIKYERDDADFDSDSAEGLWGFVGTEKTSTIDLLTDEGVALVQYLRSVHLATKIHIPPMAQRIFVYVSPDAISDMGFKQTLLNDMQNVADNPNHVIAGTNGVGIAKSVAARAGRVASAAVRS